MRSTGGAVCSSSREAYEQGERYYYGQEDKPHDDAKALAHYELAAANGHS